MCCDVGRQKETKLGFTVSTFLILPFLSSAIFLPAALHVGLDSSQLTGDGVKVS